MHDCKSSITVYRFCQVVFGLNVSPFLHNRTIRHHLAPFAEVDQTIWFQVRAQMTKSTICTAKQRSEWQTEGLNSERGKATCKRACAMAYLVYHGDDGQAHVRRTRVAPLKQLSIQRLELMSVRISAQLMNTVCNAKPSVPRQKRDGI